MSRPQAPKVVTANDLMLGHVVYLTADARWTRHLRDADILTDEADAQLRLLEAQAQVHEIVGAYLVDVDVAEQRPRPRHFREIVRAQGPSPDAAPLAADRQEMR